MYNMRVVMHLNFANDPIEGPAVLLLVAEPLQTSNVRTLLTWFTCIPSHICLAIRLVLASDLSCRYQTIAVFST